MTDFTLAERTAIALTLLDLDGWGTLTGTLVRFDPRTGERLAEPRRLVGEYDRHPRRGLPAGWIQLFIDRGWLELVPIAAGAAWRPTREGAVVRDAWLPDHLRGAESAS